MATELKHETSTGPNGGKPTKTKGGLNRMLTLEIARVTEAAAVAAARLRGRGDEEAADRAAVDAFFAAAILAGARENGAPGLRP